MGNKNKKQQREEEIKAEILKREKQRAEKSPIGRDDLISLVEYVGKNIIENGHNHNFEFTEKWVNENSVGFQELKDFLKGEYINDDWSLVIDADPYDFFGATEKRLSWMPLEKDEFESLLDWLDESLPERDCNHDYTLTKEWLSSQSVDISTTLMALMAKGGGCDCEIVYNIESENIYPKTEKT